MEKRYQVFVSSTFQDLKDERREIMQALLELECIPAGMELFPAANQDQWTLIKEVINNCDYYIVVIGGLYGSLGPTGQSYTEMEYRYALERGIPTIGFLHKNPGSIPANLSESDPKKKKQLEEFCELVKNKMCRYWENPADLGSKVSRSLIKLTKKSPGVGWVRANEIVESSSAEILRLKNRIEELEAGIEAARETAPAGTESLAQGDETFQINFTAVAREKQTGGAFQVFDAPPAEQAYAFKYKASWNDIFSAIGPLMIDEAGDETIKSGLNTFTIERNISAIRKHAGFDGKDIADIHIKDSDFQTIKVQLRALGLITKSQRQRSVKDTDTYWTLTPYGDAVMTRLRAIRRNPEE